MRISALLLVASTLLLSSCEEKKPVRSNPPAAATAPSIGGPTTPAAATAQAAPEQAPPQAKPDPIPALIESAEREYQQGQAEYKAGHLEAAKARFDAAVSVIMQGPVDVASDERLRQEFEKIVDGVHSLEMVAFKEGDGFTEQKAEPAPIDEASDVLVPADPAVKAKAEAELRQTRSDLPLVINDYVASYINFFTNTIKGRNTLINGWQRAGRYREMIFRVLKEEGVPQDLFYLAQAESGFHPVAVSRVGARGMWQFMHYTAPLYGLEKNWWIDDRQDPEKSTRAAARHLKDLYNQFGDWWLAMAAYNSGAGNVQRAVQRTGYADFWELYRRNVLPKETKNYVPIIVAMTIVAKNPLQYGLNDVAIEPPLEPDAVITNYAVDLRLAAEAVDSDVNEIAELNPALIRRVTPRDSEYELKLPHGTKDRYEQAIAAIPVDKRVAWHYHKVNAGDTLSSIARKYRVSESAIAQVNNLDGDDLTAQGKLIIPAAAKATLTESGGTYSKKATRYKVRKGDTVLSVADDFGVPADRLRRWNRLKGNNLRSGRTLFIYRPVSSEDSRHTSAFSKSSATASSKHSRSGKHSAKKSTASAAKNPASKKKRSSSGAQSGKR
jgi:membrane-bound lytic murein transglycosylase D